MLCNYCKGKKYIESFKGILERVYNPDGSIAGSHTQHSRILTKCSKCKGVGKVDK